MSKFDSQLNLFKIPNKRHFKELIDWNEKQKLVYINDKKAKKQHDNIKTLNLTLKNLKTQAQISIFTNLKDKKFL